MDWVECGRENGPTTMSVLNDLYANLFECSLFQKHLSAVNGRVKSCSETLI